MESAAAQFKKWATKLVELEKRKKATEQLAAKYKEIEAFDSHYYYKGLAEGLDIAIEVHKAE